MQAELQGSQDPLHEVPGLRQSKQPALSPVTQLHAASAILPRQQSAEAGGCLGPATPASRGGDSRPQLQMSRGALRRLSAVDPAAAAAAVLQASTDAPGQDDAASITLSLGSAVLERLQV